MPDQPPAEPPPSGPPGTGMHQGGAPDKAGDMQAAGQQASRDHAGVDLGGEQVFPGDDGWVPPPEPAGELLEDRWPDPDTEPPGGEDAWLGDLASGQLDELAIELAAARPPAGGESVGAGFTHRQAAAGIAAGEPGWEPLYAAPHPASRASGFAAGGPLDIAQAGVVLARFAEDVIDGGLAGLSDDELVGLLCAARRLTSWQTAAELSAVAELDARRQRDAAALRAADRRKAASSSQVSEHVAAEVAVALTLTGRTADGWLSLARDLRRLGPVLAALRAGEIDLSKARVFAAELAALADAAACRIAAHYLGRARDWTTSQLRRALRAAVLAHDPAAGQRRADAARKDARVEAWQEGSGNAALSGRELPAADAIAADARIGQIARALKARGAPGTLDTIRAGVFVALLLGRDPGDLLGAGGPGRGGPKGPGAGTGQRGPASAVPPGLGSPGVAQPGLSLLGGVIHLTLPAMTWLGLAGRPGEIAGFGPVDAFTARDLADRLAASGAARWHVTLTDGEGHAVAHACTRRQPGARNRPPPGPAWPAPGWPGSGAGWPGAGWPGAGWPGAGWPGSGSASGPGPPGGDARAGWLAGLDFEWLERGICRHPREASGYRPGRRLRHLLAVRNPTCTAPGCRRPAASCDNEHTVPYDRGGRTCECNCGPACRRHHRAKQAPGWAVTQPEPGVLVWSTPSGRRYVSRPEPYLV